MDFTKVQSYILDNEEKFYVRACIIEYGGGG